MRTAQFASAHWWEGDNFQPRASRRGLYDVALGLHDSARGLCSTCALPHRNCTGHIGHIDLGLPVYHPLLIGTLVDVLARKCLACHHLRSWSSSQPFFNQLKLVEMGQWRAASSCATQDLSPESKVMWRDMVILPSLFPRSAHFRRSRARLARTRYRPKQLPQVGAGHLTQCTSDACGKICAVCC